MCGNAKSLMPVWSNLGNPPGPLNYIQIEELIAFMRSDDSRTYNVRDPELNEPIIDPATGENETFKGWYDETWRPAPDATPVPACYLRRWRRATPDPAPTPPPDAPVLEVVAEGIAFDVKELEAPADTTFVIHFENQDQAIPHDVEIRLGDGTVVVDNASSAVRRRA